jgi:hypothetical protein
MVIVDAPAEPTAVVAPPSTSGVTALAEVAAIATASRTRLSAADCLPNLIVFSWVRGGIGEDILAPPGKAIKNN